MAPMLTGLGQLAIVVAIWAGGNNVIDGAGLSVGDVSTFTQYMGLIITPLALLAQVMPLIIARRRVRSADHRGVPHRGHDPIGDRRLSLNPPIG